MGTEVDHMRSPHSRTWGSQKSNLTVECVSGGLCFEEDNGKPLFRAGRGLGPWSVIILTSMSPRGMFTHMQPCIRLIFPAALGNTCSLCSRECEADRTPPQHTAGQDGCPPVSPGRLALGPLPAARQAFLHYRGFSDLH